MKRTHRSADLTTGDIGNKVVLDGWVRKTRDLGSLLFIDLRDVSGLVQVTFTTDNQQLYEEAKKLRMEDVVEIRGVVQKRHEKNINTRMKTGEIEVRAESLEILSRSEVPPFVIDEDLNASEELRFKYRYLDLRREKARDNFLLRGKAVMTVRKYFEKNGFTDFETPVLIKSTPEGARDYLVPSRVHKGKFYALPQSPQIYKQILMIAGFDRYIQIPKCFRDEDLRADRQPEFTQIDVEMSFIEEEDIFVLIEGLFAELWNLIGVRLNIPFPRLTWKEAMDRFGSDKPDMRFGLELKDITPAAATTGLEIFRSEPGKPEKTAKALTIPEAASWSRKTLDDLGEQAKKAGAKGLLWIKLEGGETKSPILKQLGDEKTRGLAAAAGAKEGDLVLIVSDNFVKASTVLGILRIAIADELKLRKENEFKFLWVYDFPLFEWSEEEGRFTSSHHPFTQPRPEHLDKLETSPGEVLSRAYDVICNGSELGGGSMRIHRSDVQARIFKALGIGKQEAEEKFGYLLEALKYGAPPHGGIALGMDRIAAFLCGEKSIKEVIAFPKTTSAWCPMTDSPSAVDEKTLIELGLALTQKKD
jgi:aspartyl-tRNA synthetase